MHGEPILSRTDHHDPYWVRAEWWEPSHNRCQYSWIIRRDCDLPDEPVVGAEYGARWRYREHCHWVPARGVSYLRRDRYGYGGVPDWFNRVYFTKPERRRVRDQLARARAEYRATREVDVVPSTAQHRHMGRWLYW